MAIMISILFDTPNEHCAISYTNKTGLNAVLIAGVVLQSTAIPAIHLQFDISANAFVIKTVQSPKCIVKCADDCTLLR
jgi:hypothetical protein